MAIPADDLTRQYSAIASEVEVALRRVLPSGKYTMGPELHGFEQEFARYIGASHAVGISNGTEALHMALLACGVGPGDEVITTPMTYIATVFAISYTGATPVFVDVEPDTFNLDPGELEGKISERTKAIVPVHLYGHPVDMDAVLAVAHKHGLKVIEDASHAHGATYNGKKAGALGDVACFSFYPSKVLGAFGDGGAATTDDAALAESIAVLRYMGQHQKYVHEVVGYQQRLSEVQAAVLRVKLPHLDGWVDLRRRWAHLYGELLAGLPVVTPIEKGGVRHVYYVYTILTKRRQELVQHLNERGIGAHVMYPYLVPFTPAYAHLGVPPGSLPVAEKLARELVCLPMFPELSEEEVRQVVDAVRGFFSRR